MNPAHMDLSGDLWKKGIKKIWNPSTKSMESIPHFMEYILKSMESIPQSMESIPHFMESILKKYGVHPPVHGIHPPFHGFHLKKVWSPSPIPWENYGVHPPFHGFHLEFLESTPHSMDSIWIIPGRVKYSIWVSHSNSAHCLGQSKHVSAFSCALYPHSIRLGVIL